MRMAVWRYGGMADRNVGYQGMNPNSSNLPHLPAFPALPPYRHTAYRLPPTFPPLAECGDRGRRKVSEESPSSTG